MRKVLLTIIIWLLCLGIAQANCIIDKYNFQYCTPGTAVTETWSINQPGVKFLQWRGTQCSGSVNPVCTFSMPADKDVYLEAWTDKGWPNPAKSTIYRALPGMIIQGKDGSYQIVPKVTL